MNRQGAVLRVRCGGLTRNNTQALARRPVSPACEALAEAALGCRTGPSAISRPSTAWFESDLPANTAMPQCRPSEAAARLHTGANLAA